VPTNWPPLTPGFCGSRQICAAGLAYWDRNASPDTVACGAVAINAQDNYCQGYCCNLTIVAANRAAVPGSCTTLCVSGYSFARISTQDPDCRQTREITDTLNCDVR
jgi:hypothetical protein